MPLKDSMVFGVKWSLIAQLSRQGMQLCSTAILARLLSPTDFGLVGMATIVISFISIFKDLGTASALIQRKDISNNLLSSIFWINLAFGGFAMVILLISAPLAADFYNQPRITQILRVLSLNFLVSGVSTLQNALLERKLAFNTLAQINITATVFGALIGVGSALLGFGVWSLVFQSITIVLTTTLLLWIASDWKPQFIFDWGEVKKIISYSANLTGFNTFRFFTRNADYILIGKFLGAQDLGYYTLAYRLMLYPLQNISSVIGRVMFPVLSRVQGDNTRFSRAYLKVVSTIAIITFPMMLALWAVAESFILTIFGSQWEPVIFLLMILAPIGMTQSLGTTVGVIYQAKSRTDLQLRWGVFSGAMVIIAFIVGLKRGIAGVAIAYVAITLTLLYPSYRIAFSLIDLAVRDLVLKVWKPFFCSSVMLGVLIGLKDFILPADLSSSIVLCTLVTTGLAVYLLISWMLNREQIQELASAVGFDFSKRS